MRITATRSLGPGWPALKEGQTADVEQSVGERLVKLGLGVDVSAPTPAVLQAVPPAVEFNTAPATEVAPIVAAIPTAPEPAAVLNSAAELEPTEENTAPAGNEATKQKRR